MSTLPDIARKYGKSTDEVRRALPRVGYDARNLGPVATIPADIERKLEAHWLAESESVPGGGVPVHPGKPRSDAKRMIGATEIVTRKRRKVNRPLPPRSHSHPSHPPRPTTVARPTPGASPVATPTPTPTPQSFPAKAGTHPPPPTVQPASPTPGTTPPVATPPPTPTPPVAPSVATSPPTPTPSTPSVPPAPAPPAVPFVDKKPGEQLSAAEQLWERQLAAQRQASHPAPESAPTPADPAPDSVPEASTTSPPAVSAEPSPAPVPAPASRLGRNTITIDEKVVTRRRKKRERQAPRRSGPAAENIHAFQRPDEPAKRTVKLPATVSIQNLAEQLAMKAGALRARLREIGWDGAANETLDRETAWLMVEELGHKAVELHERDPETEILPPPETGGDLQSRPPVVTVMGHVDHGKTSLLDALRKTRVAAREAGGITQHIGAHQVASDSGAKITFIDTPGHELFTEMRARGAKVTDLVVLVVAADDGVKPQTLEAVSHAKAAEVPMIVAANKMDKADADLERVKRELSENGVVPEEWGGDAMIVPVSAETGSGLKELLDAVALQSEVLELKSPADAPAVGAVIEGRMDKGRGPVASVIVRSGTLRRGDAVLCGAESGKIRAMWGDDGKAVSEAGPSFPVEIQGLSGLPEVGSELRALADGRKAREVAELRGERDRAGRLSDNLKPPEDLAEALAALAAKEAKTELRIVLKADVSGSREALSQALEKISGDAGEVKILHSGVGGVSESDAHLADSGEATIVAFNVRPDARARKLMERRKIRMLSGNVIYDIVESARDALAGMMDPVEEDRVLGTAEVLRVFPIAKAGNVAGCRVSEGIVRQGGTARLLRDGKVVWRGEIASLRRFKENAPEVRAGDECGILLRRFNDAKAGDTVEVYETALSTPKI